MQQATRALGKHALSAFFSRSARPLWHSMPVMSAGDATEDEAAENSCIQLTSVVGAENNRADARQQLHIETTQ